jgi:diguanylate cyclase (GGDEF)-like protein
VRRLFSRHNRFLAAIGGLAFGAIVAVGLAYASTESERLDIQTETRAATDLRSLATRLSNAARDEDQAIDEYMLSGDSIALSNFEQAVADENAAATAMTDAARQLPQVQAAVQAIRDASSSWQASFARPAIAAVKTGRAADLEPFTQAVVDEHAAVDAALEDLGARLTQGETALVQRGDRLSVTRTAATAIGFVVMFLVFVLALWLIRRYGRVLELDALQASVVNRFTEVTSFAADDKDVAGSNLEALTLLVHPDAGVTHVLNRSKDRALPEATLGAATAEVLPLNALSRCVGIVRGSLYVTDDAQAPLSVHCPVYPVTHGTLACIPLNSGESVGAVHLYWERPNALPLELRASVARITEHAALAIGNRRLLAALQGQASTDARTGLANSRSFDLALEEALVSRGSDETVAVLMLDIDHFKDFNNRHGHPAGDEALRAFAEVLRSCMREGDVAARYGGEEFAVLLPGVDARSALTIAERIRGRAESTIVSLAPGITDRITVSIGIGMAPEQGLERVSLLRVADEALYRAKQAGRNRVDYLGGSSDVSTAVPSRQSSRRGRRAISTAGAARATSVSDGHVAEG